jgi:hypothetical protein
VIDQYNLDREITIMKLTISADYHKESNTSNWRTDSRRRLRPRSNLIYPMRARSNTRYRSPPPPYEMYRTPPPGYSMPGQTADPEETEVPAEPEPDRNLDMVSLVMLQLNYS